MLSQATVQDACLRTIDEMRANRTYNYVIFKLTDDQKQIIVDKAEVTTDYKEFLDALPKNVPRYAICEFPFDDQEGYPQVAVIYYVWLADDANIGLKLKYQNNSDALRRKLAGISVEIEASNVDDIARDTVLRRLK